MDWQQFAAATGAAGAILGAVFGALGKTWSDSRASDQRTNLDQLQLALATVGKLEAKADIQAGQIANLQKAILELTVVKTRIEMESIQFRRDIHDLQKQVRALGHEPVVSDDVANGVPRP